ncbi:hypothetical protein BJV82DRAFT_346714 [Fennellomyces sp. T-0311]|nr:hypothetical protein BJV82DRAFT_346714 [Fennellomyces sp. T-0311]
MNLVAQHGLFLLSNCSCMSQACESEEILASKENSNMQTFLESSTIHPPLACTMDSDVAEGEPSNPVSKGFATLPSEILSYIFAELSIDDRVTCIRVCKSWCDFIYSNAGMWRTIQVDDHTTKLIALCNDLRIIGRHVTELNVVKTKNFSHGNIILREIAQRKHILNLHSLKLLYYVPLPNDTTILTAGLRHLGGTLTRLHVFFVTQPIVPLFTILKICPNLTHVTYLMQSLWASSLKEVDTLSAPKKCHRVIALRIGSYFMSSRELDAVLQHFPNLRILDVHGCDPPAVSIISRRCQLLDELNVNEVRYRFPALFYKRYEPDLTKAGSLRRLFLGNYPDADDIPLSTIMDLIDRGRNTLEEIYLSLDYDDHSFAEQYPRRQRPFNLCMPQLRILRCEMNLQSLSQEYIALCIQNSPNLNLVRLWTSIGGIRDIVYNALATLPDLQCLELLAHSSNDDMTALANVFRNVARHGSLQSIILGGNKIDQEVISALVEISSLREITLYLHRMTHHATNELVVKLRHCSSLERVHFYLMDSVTDTTLQLLANLPKITHVKLTSLFSISPHGVRALIDIAPSLTHLRVHGHMYFPEDLKAYAEARLTSFHAEIDVKLLSAHGAFDYSDTAYEDSILFTSIPDLQEKGF